MELLGRAPVACAHAGAIGALLALRRCGCAGRISPMVTIAFGFVVENLAIEWRSVTGGQNGIMGVAATLSFWIRARRARRRHRRIVSGRRGDIRVSAAFQVRGGARRCAR